MSSTDVAQICDDFESVLSCLMLFIWTTIFVGYSV